MPPRKHAMQFDGSPAAPSSNGKGDATDAEMRELERDLGRLDENELSIRDDYKTTVDALLSILQGDARTGTPGLDEQRAQLRQRIAIAMELKERDEVKNLKEAYQKVLKRMHAALRRLVEALAREEAQGLRENVQNWLHVRMNLRTVITKSLLVRHGIDLSSVIAQAEEREAEARAAMVRQAAEKEEQEADEPEKVPA